MSTRSTLIAIVLWALPAASLGQPAPADEPEVAEQTDTPVTGSSEERAAAAFGHGQQAFLEDDYERALASFEEAQRLAPHDVVRFNIALCLERLGRFRRALDEYRHAEGSSQLDAANRADAAQRRERVQARLGTVVVAGPAGALVEVVDVEECTAPCRVLVDPGPHQVRRVDDATQTRTVSVERGAEQVVDLAPAQEDRRDDRPPEGFQLRIGLMGWIGAGVALAGTLGTFAFGIRAAGLHDRYLEDPTPDRRDSGRTAVALTNVSLVVALLGAAAVAVDVFWLQRRDERPAPGETLALAF